MRLVSRIRKNSEIGLQRQTPRTPGHVRARACHQARGPHQCLEPAMHSSPTAQGVLTQTVPPGPLRELQVPQVTPRQGPSPPCAQRGGTQAAFRVPESRGTDRKPPEPPGAKKRPAASCPPEAWTLGLSQGRRLGSETPGPPLTALPQGAGALVPGKVGAAAGAGSSYQDAILGNRGVRTSWVKMNQATAMRLPATPPYSTWLQV